MSYSPNPVVFGRTETRQVLLLLCFTTKLLISDISMLADFIYGVHHHCERESLAKCVRRTYATTGHSSLTGSRNPP
jgi:hypothetical protein